MIGIVWMCVCVRVRKREKERERKRVSLPADLPYNLPLLHPG